MASRVVSPLALVSNQFREPRIERPHNFRGLKRTPIKRKKRLNPVGRLRRVTQQVYREKRDKFMREHPVCQYPNCSKASFDPHHRHGREGKNYLDTSTWSALCREHHNWVHAHPNQAREMGLLK